MKNEEGNVKNGVFIEESIVDSVKKLLTGRGNELLGEMEFMIPPIEFAHKTTGGYYAVTPDVAVLGCERSEKERIIRLDAYTLTIIFTVPENPDGERNCYAYAGAVATALGENPTLGGVASRAVLTGKKYVPPKHSGTGGDWEAVLTLRLTVQTEPGNGGEFC
jgi:hypothetical protein